MKKPKLIGTRLFSFGTLAALVTGISYGGHQTWRAATDSFVAPIILSPDNDIILANKVRLAELEVDGDKTRAEIEALDADLAAAELAVARLVELREKTSTALVWTTTITAQRASADAYAVKKLRDERAALVGMVAEQEKLTTQARANADAGLVSAADYAREAQALGHLRVALLETKREQRRSEEDLAEAALARRSLAHNGDAPPMPEIVAREEQLVRVELELFRLSAELRSKRAERRIAAEKLAKLAALESELKARPIFRAAEQSLDVAFVPYTQIEGVQAGAVVYDCTWGLFSCKAVGTVKEVVPGESVLPDPWGRQARGQLAVLDLHSRDAARAKVLRVRPVAGPVAAPRATGETVSVR